MGNSSSCSHERTEIRDIEHRVHTEAGVLWGLLGDRHFQFATCYCLDCPVKCKVVRYKSWSGSWNEWNDVDDGNCWHTDNCLEVLTTNTNTKSKDIDTVLNFFLGDDKDQSPASIASAKCRRCGKVFESAARQVVKERWQNQKIVRKCEWEINLNKLTPASKNGWVREVVLFVAGIALLLSMFHSTV